MLLVGSGQDRLLPSLSEQIRLQRLLPFAQRLVLPDSGHTALLEVIPFHLLHCAVATACSWQPEHKMSSMDCRF